MASLKSSVDEKRTVVEEGTKIRGDVESVCPVVVHGRVEGDVKAPSLTVTASGVVEGTARVGTIQCEGELSGEFDADHIELSGLVKHSTVIRAETFEIKLASKNGKKQLVFEDAEPGAAQVSDTQAGAEPPSDDAPKAEEGLKAKEPKEKDRLNGGRPSEAPPAL